MIKVRFLCRDCGREFVLDIFEPGEAKEKRLPSYPIGCPHCRSGNVKRIG